MSQVRIYGHRASLAPRRQAWSDCIHGCLVETLGLPDSKRFHRFFPMDPADFIHPADRTEHYTIIEISMFAGRTEETKRRLIRLLLEWIETELGISVQDAEITIFESPAASWGIRGRCGDELALDYDVRV
ncbi:MAG TPA: tautomerase family protein [Thermomicrobiales bacterium]|nr:tautomerase family protein [Thermomicrobiales bacterium]